MSDTSNDYQEETGSIDTATTELRNAAEASQQNSTKGISIQQEKEASQMDDAYYVAIGASAGGLEAIKLFFQNMPSGTGAAFIVVQHLSPDFKSVMSDLLRRDTNMSIYNVEDNMQVEANSIYLIPPRKNMMIAEGKLILVDQMPSKGVNFPIDIFFRSIAEDQQHHSIGIILSGTGSDGSRGIQAIKEVGGLVLVQEPTTAKFDGMPRSAMNSGFAEMALNVEQIPQKLVSYMTHPLIRVKESGLGNQLREDQQALQQILKLLHEQSRIDFSAYKAATLVRRIERRIGVQQLRGLSDYHKLLLSDAQELQLLAKDMLIGVTRFFRDENYFKIIETQVIPEIFQRLPEDETIRVWVAGCSTGEEAYSLAILFDEAKEKARQNRKIKIFATDVDPNAIAEASMGYFDLNIAADLSAKRLLTFFKKENNHYVVTPAIRNMIVFANHNLMKDPPFSNTHLSVCRNVLIYFRSALQRRIMSMLHFSLQKGGFLFLGPSESLNEVAGFFEAVDERSRIYKKVVSATLPGPRHVHSDLDKIPTTPPPLDTLISSYQRTQKVQNASAVLDNLIRYYKVPPCILVGDKQEVLYIFGDVSDVTRKPKEGEFSSQVQDILHRQISVAVSTAIGRVKASRGSVIYQGLEVVGTDNNTLVYDLRVCFLTGKHVLKESYVIFFELNHNQQANQTLPQQKEPGLDVVGYDPCREYQQRVKDLEIELKNKQEHLQVTIEELEATNEELQSSNEELLSANEELQSTNEELQSVNEELYTVNSEYHDKIGELTRANADVDNLMKSTDLGIIFLDDSMLVRKFTQAATHTFNLLPADINRPFHHISNNFRQDGILDDIAECIEKRNSIEKELSTVGNQRIILKIQPYMNEQHQHSGVVLVANDITRVRSLESKITRAYQHFKDIFGGLSGDRPTRTLSVLILDDRDADRQWLSDSLIPENLGEPRYKIFEAKEHRNALDILKEVRIEICLVDYNLGHEKNALDFIEELSQSMAPSDMPIFILLSAVLTDEIRERANTLPIYDAIDKDKVSGLLLDRCIIHALQKREVERFFVNSSN